MNNVCLVGRLTRDPELRTTSGGLATTSFSLAVDSGRRDETGRSSADFITCVAWRNQAENLCKYCGKGSMISVQGRITSRSYDAQDGSKRYVTEVVANNITFLSSRNSGNGSGFTDNMPDYSMGDIQSNTMDIEDSFAGIGNEVLTDDDDLPF